MRLVCEPVGGGFARKRVKKGLRGRREGVYGWRKKKEGVRVGRERRKRNGELDEIASACPLLLPVSSQ